MWDVLKKLKIESQFAMITFNESSSQKSDAIKLIACATHRRSKICGYALWVNRRTTQRFNPESVTTAANLSNPIFSSIFAISCAIKSPVWLTVLYTFNLIKYSLRFGVVTI